MSFRNRDKQSRVESRESRAKHLKWRSRCSLPGYPVAGAAPRTLRTSRRGVLLLVVLSLLVLFMLIGTAFLMSSNQYRRSATASAKLNRVGNYPTKLLDRAMMQVLCDTGNRNSAIRYHSLLRDLYGAEGFEAVVYSPIDSMLRANFPSGSYENNESQLTRFAMPPNGNAVNPPLGPTQGQFIDIYVRELAFKANDPLTLGADQTTMVSPDARHVLKLEPSVLGMPEMFNMPLTKGYFNGCLLTMTSGPARGQSTRILDYEYVGDLAPPLSSPPTTTPFPAKPVSRLFRFRVMTFPNASGQPLVTRSQLPTTDPRYSNNAARGLEIADLVTEVRDNGGTITQSGGHTFIVNGRPFNGTGVGFNELARAGEPRLNAVETVGIVQDEDDWMYAPIALTPNAVYHFPSDPLNHPTNAANDLWGARYLTIDPSTGDPIYSPLNPTRLATVPLANRPQLWKYQNFAGPGDADESYDAPDFQNVALAMQTVSPRARGRVVQGNAATPTTLEVDHPSVNPSQFLRLDLEDLPLPSYHRPDLINYWFHQLLNAPFLVNELGDEDDRVRSILGDTSVISDPRVEGQIAALKRKISLRPLREDHPNFDGSNPASRPPTLSGTLVRNGNIAVPFWEAVGPWDVDNDNDGVPDSIWVDLGDPVAQAEDGTLYKPLYAFLIVDLDSKLNVNAHGLVDHLRSPDFAYIPNPAYASDPLNEPAVIPAPNLAHDLTAGGLSNSNYLASGLGYGPAEISLRSIFSPNLPGNADPTLASRIGNPAYDDFARILVGRPATGQQPSVWGRHGSVNVRETTTVDWTDNVAAATQTLRVRPGIPYQGAVPPAAFDFASADRLALFKFIGYPTWLSNYYGILPTPSSFSTPPDLQGRFALGLDYTGQPVTEARADAFVNGDSQSLLIDSPYELNLSAPSRRATPDASVTSTITSTPAAAVNDDAPFATAELERIARAHDGDAGVLPDRLWNLVDAFDPLKLTANQPELVRVRAEQMFNNSNPNAAQRLAAAQQIASENRRLVTTDSYDLPVLATSLPAYVSQFGPDGMPGRAGFDDDDDGNDDNVGELNTLISDDLRNIVGKSRAQCTIIDVLRYRVWCEMRKQVMRENSWDEVALTGLSAANYTTFLANVTARTDALMNGEPFVDTNGNGVRDNGENFTDLNGNGAYDASLPRQLLAPEVLAGKKMNLNRPFGDGRDNGDGIDNNVNGLVDETGEAGDTLLNGIVDDPAEAGEPYLDRNGNGKWDAGEPFVDMFQDNAGGRTEIYDGPRDRLWSELTDLTNGPLHEVIAFDYTNGHGEPLHPEASSGMAAGGVRNLNSQGRQLFARHLYCLMMLLMDEHYLEMPDLPALDGNNLNLELLLMKIAVDNGGTAFAATDFDKLQARRKLTAQRVAQWAINAVDQRDADSIMTAFEYDENPFDGWGCLDANRVNIPLDGDLGTDENFGVMIDWDIVDATNATTRKPTKQLPENMRPVTNSLVDNQTRGVVWGVERPELLITETLALHDRRCTDEPENGSIVNFNPNAPPEQRDYDLDQRLKPRGSLFVEIYNPWSADGSRAAEFYGRTPTSGVNENGVMLNRLSDTRDTVSQKFSPVWRMSVLRDPLNGRLPVFKNLMKKLDSGVLDLTTGFPAPVASDQESVSADFLTIDPDGYNVNLDESAERHVYFTTGRNYATGNGSDANRSDDDNNVNEPGTLGEWDYSAGTPNPVVNQLQVRVPPLPQPRQEIVAGDTHVVPRAKRYFVARNERVASAIPNDVDTTIAPILPGRYAVIGSSGLQLRGSGASTSRAEDGQTTERFVTPISRDASQPENGNGDKELFGPGVAGRLPGMRRIELWPDQSGRPDVHQVLVSENGGDEFVRIDNNTVVNATDPNLDGNPTTTPAANMLIDPAVAIPVEDLSISEPVEGYPSITYRKMYEKSPPVTTAGSQPKPPEYQLRLTDQGDLEFWDPFQTQPDLPAYYDRPLDTEFELVRNGTTQNYRSVHLQRLANPTMPWNPLPLDSAGNPHPMHRSWLPVNPYRTIDSQSVDLTAYNGASTLERTNLPVNMAFDRDFTTDLLQSNIVAPITAAQFLAAPDHEIWAMILLMKLKMISIGNSPEELRGLGETAAGLELIETRLSELEPNELEPAARGDLTATVNEQPPPGAPPGWQPKFPNGMQDGWHWHMYRRVLPDDQLPGVAPNAYRQWLHFKSLERGYHASSYFKHPKPGAFYSSNPASLEGWAPDASVRPRTLWKQERPNARLFLKGPSGVVDASDLKTVTSWRVLSHTPGNPKLTTEEENTTIPDSEISRNQLVWNSLTASTTPSPQPLAVFDYVMEQTLGFANRTYTPDLERVAGGIASTIISNPRRGAPEVATNSNRRPANPVTYDSLPDKEIWNAQRRAARLATAPNPPTPQPSLLQAAVNDPMSPPTLAPALVDEFYERRRILTSSTFPWLNWNDRPFTGAHDIMHVPAWSSSMMLRGYSIPNLFTTNAYDGERLIGTPAALKTVAQQLAGQNAPFGHLLNFFASSFQPAVPAAALTSPADPTGAPNFQRLLEYVEVPSRYVGTETVLSPEIFNDALGVVDTHGSEILNPGDPRNGFRPPFNKVSRERDPGKVNLNTVTGRRVPATASNPPLHRSEVYDGLMHRYGDSNLLDAASNVLQLSHFGPAWRDVVLSRRGYVQFNADGGGNSVDKLDTVPDTFAFGLNRNFPSVFSNPFRSADAGDLVPIPLMVRSGVNATMLRGHHYGRARDFNLETNPFASNGTSNSRIAWGVAGVDDDRNGIVDDICEAGFGDVNATDGDRIRRTPDPINPTIETDQLGSSGIPLFSEQMPEPAIDAERNPGMMYQPMTRLGNLVTTRSNVYAIWVTVGYFEVERAPDWSLQATRERFGGTTTDTDAATVRARALYDRVYPEGYMLGEELGTDTGNTNRPRAFYIIDRTEPVGFKPGEDLNVDRMIRVRRRIE